MSINEEFTFSIAYPYHKKISLVDVFEDAKEIAGEDCTPRLTGMSIVANCYKGDDVNTGCSLPEKCYKFVAYKK